MQFDSKLIPPVSNIPQTFPVVWPCPACFAILSCPIFRCFGCCCSGGLGLFAGLPAPTISIATANALPICSARTGLQPSFLNPNPRFTSVTSAGLTHWLADWNPEALILEANFRYLSSPAAIRWMHTRSRSVIGWGLGASVDRRPASALRERFLRQFDALIAYSQRGLSNMPPGGILRTGFRCPNAVAPAPKHPLPARGAVFGEGSCPRCSLLCCSWADSSPASGFRPAEGLCRTPGAAQTRLVIVGDGPELDNLRSLAQSLYPSAEFPGAKHGQELAAYFLARTCLSFPAPAGWPCRRPCPTACRSSSRRETAHRMTSSARGTVGKSRRMTILPYICLAGGPQRCFAPAAMGAESYRIVAQEINLERMVGCLSRR